jgi:hypothetical protein
VVLGGLAAGIGGFLWYRSQQEPPTDGEGGPDEPQPPTGPEDFEDIPPAGVAAGAAAAADDSIFPTPEAEPGATPSDETEPVDIGPGEEASPGQEQRPDDAAPRT